MSRHTLSDGTTHDSRLDGAFDLWMPELSPGPKLVGSWYRNEIPWDDFCSKYEQRLAEPPATRAIAKIVDLLARCNVTLMCIEEDARNCHRSVLLRHCLTQSR